jgi:hypothetical protein
MVHLRHHCIRWALLRQIRGGLPERLISSGGG